MEPLHTPSRSDSEPIGAPTGRPVDEAPPGYSAPPPPPFEEPHPDEPTWRGNRSFARVEPVSGAIVGGVALVILGFLVLVAPVILRWVVGIGFVVLGVGALMWGNSRAARHRHRSDVDRPFGEARY